MNTIAFVCMIASGTALPLMDIIFGQFINVFNNFATGQLSPAGYRGEVGRYRHVSPPTVIHDALLTSLEVSTLFTCSLGSSS